VTTKLSGALINSLGCTLGVTAVTGVLYMLHRCKLGVVLTVYSCVASLCLFVGLANLVLPPLLQVRITSSSSSSSATIYAPHTHPTHTTCCSSSKCGRTALRGVRGVQPWGVSGSSTPPGLHRGKVAEADAVHTHTRTLHGGWLVDFCPNGGKCSACALRDLGPASLIRPREAWAHKKQDGGGSASEAYV